MSGAPEPRSSEAPSSSQKGRGLLPPEIVNFVMPPLQFGGFCGGAGAFTGVGAAILSDASPIASGIMTGTQWAVLGTTYWFSRQVAFRALGGEERATPIDKVKASAIASVPTGAVLGVSVSKTRAVGSSMAFCGVVAVGGQLLVNRFANRSKDPEDENNGSWLRSKWSPLKKMSDDEYRHTMDEKILRVDADIALIDDRIAHLKNVQANNVPGESPWTDRTTTK